MSSGWHKIVLLFILWESYVIDVLFVLELLFFWKLINNFSSILDSDLSIFCFFPSQILKNVKCCLIRKDLQMCTSEENVQIDLLNQPMYDIHIVMQPSDISL